MQWSLVQWLLSFQYNFVLCGIIDEFLCRQTQALVTFGGVCECCTTANLTAALVPELLTVILLACGQHVSTQQRHTLAQLANTHWHSCQIHSPGMGPPDASGIFFSMGTPFVQGITQWLPASPAEALPHEGASALEMHLASHLGTSHKCSSAQSSSSQPRHVPT